MQSLGVQSEELASLASKVLSRASLRTGRVGFLSSWVCLTDSNVSALQMPSEQLTMARLSLSFHSFGVMNHAQRRD